MKFRTLEEIEALLIAQNVPATRILYEVWDQRQLSTQHRLARSAETLPAGFDWLKQDVRLATSFLKCALRCEEYLLASDAAQEALQFWEFREEVSAQNVCELARGLARVKSRIGQSAVALRILEPWSRDPRLDDSQRAAVLIQLGDILSEEAYSAVDPSIRFQRGERAVSRYGEAARLMCTSVEARSKLAVALLSVSSDRFVRKQEARRCAMETLEEVARIQDKRGKGFKLAQYLAMLLAVAGKLDEAAQAYESLDSYPEASNGELADVRYESQFIALGLDLPKAFFKPMFPPLELIAFAGHMPDLLPGAPSRFPLDLVPEVKATLRRELSKADARVAILSAAAGADLLFIEAFLERPKSELHLVLPWSTEEFLRASVQPYDEAFLDAEYGHRERQVVEADAKPDNVEQVPEAIERTFVDQAESKAPWRPLFEMAMERTSTLRQLSQFGEPGDEVGWQYAMEVTAGIAVHTARTRRLDLKPMVLWNGLPGRGAGGTAHFFEFWNNFLGYAPHIINLPKCLRSEARIVLKSTTERCEKPTMHREVKTILFADIVGYSKLSEGVIPEFVKVFLSKLSRLIAESPNPPLCVNMWGDEIYGAFDHAREAGLFGLQLSRFLQEEEEQWVENGLYYEETDPSEHKVQRFPLNIRIGLHTGPVLAIYNPVVRQLTYTGMHVTLAARIQPVVVPGEVYASEEFAAMLELDMAGTRCSGSRGPIERPGGHAVCKYIGAIQLAKNFPGRFRIYRVVAERAFPVEELAAAAHQLYCQKQLAKGDLPADSPAHLKWQDLPEDYREANRSQVADIPFKLGLVGYELSSGPGLHPKGMNLTAEQIEMLAKKEHERWAMERERSGWTYGSHRDDARKHHPNMVPWEHLPDSEKEKDRETIRDLPKLIELAGLRLAH